MATYYELYSDEHAHAGKRYLVLGGVVCTEARTALLRARLQAIRADWQLTAEMKWGKVSHSKIGAYVAWVDAFFTDPYARFFVFPIDKSSHQWANFHSADKLASAFHQFLLVSFGSISDMKRWSVYPDAGLFRRDAVLRRVDFLFNRIYKEKLGLKASRVIWTSGSIDSKHDDMIQLADVLLGTLSYVALGGSPESSAKRTLIEHCSDALGSHPQTHSGAAKLTHQEWVSPADFGR